MFQKINFNKIKKNLIKLPEFLAKNDFAAFLLLFIVGLIISTLIFYEYSYLVQKKEIKITEITPQFRKEDYREILKIWEERDKRFQEAEFLFFSNPFQKTKIEKQEELQPEIPLQNLETAVNLYRFYLLKGEILPPIEERAKLWEELGLGSASEYSGAVYQNQKLLKELMKIF